VENCEYASRGPPQFPGELAQIDFRDQGRGLAPELLEAHLRARLYDDSGQPGLGLSVCKNVIEQHGGEIRVHSKPQQGSTFRSSCLFLPEQTHEQCLDRGRRGGHARGAGG